MDDITSLLLKHGYWLLFLCIVGRQACLPVPVSLFVLDSGAMIEAHRFNTFALLATVIPAFIATDLVWYEIGKRFGKHLLWLIDKSPSGMALSVDRYVSMFHRYGVRSLLVSKFILGFDALGAPASGLFGVGLSRFVLFDGLGALIWTTAYLALGYEFRDQLDRIAEYLGHAGHLVAWVGLAVLGSVIVRLAWRRYRVARKSRSSLRHVGMPAKRLRRGEGRDSSR